MTVARSRSPSLSGLPGKFPEDPKFQIPRKKVGSGSTRTPKPVSAEEMQLQQQQRVKADQQMRQVLQPVGTARKNGPADKNGGPPSAAPSSAAHAQQRGPGNPGNRTLVKRKPLDEVIPSGNWALEPKEYKALQENPDDPRALFHIAFYGPGPQALPPVLNPQDRVPARTPSGLSTRTYPPGTAKAQPFLSNNSAPPLRNARSWQGQLPQQATPYPLDPEERAPAQSLNVPPQRPPKEPLDSNDQLPAKESRQPNAPPQLPPRNARKVPPALPPRNTYTSNVPPPRPPKTPLK